MPGTVGTVPRRPIIGQPAPRFELPVHGAEDDSRLWSLDDALERGCAVVLIFHRHIH